MILGLHLWWSLQGKRRADAVAVDHLTVETGAMLSQRLMSFWDELMVSLSTNPPESPPRKIGLVSHGAAIRHLCEDLAVRRGDRFTFELPTGATFKEASQRRLGNCCITEILVMARQPGHLSNGQFIKYADETHFIESSRAPTPSRNEDDIDE